MKITSLGSLLLMSSVIGVVAGGCRSSIGTSHSDIGDETAARKAKAFLKRIGFREVPERLVVRKAHRENGSAAYVFDLPEGAFIAVDGATGAIRSYENRRRDDMRRRGQLPGRLPYSNRASVQIHLRKLAAVLGVPADYKAVDFQILGYNFAPANTASDGGYASVFYQPMPHGYRIHDRLDSFYLRVDNADGMLCAYSREGPKPYKLESWDVRIPLSRAQQIAKPIATRFSVGRWRPGELEFRKGSKLPPARASYAAYVVPNGVYGSKDWFEGRVPHRHRLAWVICYPRDEEIWVDAGNGEILGGVYGGKG